MKTEKILTIIFLLGLIFKMLDIPGMVIILILTLGLLSMLYFPFAFYFFSDKTIKNQNVTLSIIGGIVLSIAPLGILFKLLAWPGAIAQLTIATYATPVLLITCVLLRSIAKDELFGYYRNLIIRTSFWIVMSITFYSVSSQTLIKIQYRNEPELVRLKIQALEDPNNLDYKHQIDNYYRQRDSIEIKNIQN